MVMTRTILAGLLCGLVPAAVVGARQSWSDRQSEWKAPAAADTKQNPLASRPETHAGGAKLFAERCSACHADDGTGTSRGPNLTLKRVQSQTDGALFWKISSGNTRTGMPAFSGIPALQRWQLVSHVRALVEAAP